MRRIVILTLLYICVSSCCAQIYRYPVFDRTDEPRFHIDSVELTKDSTFLYCSYEAAGSSWVQISNHSFLRDKESGKSYTIAAVTGIPFHPDKCHFIYNTHVLIKLSFASNKKLRYFDFIESMTDHSAFNIYGIDLSNQYVKQYSLDEERRFTNQADFYSSINDSLMLLYRNQEIEARKFLHGKKSDAVTLSLYQLATSYNRLGNHSKAIEYGLQALDCQAKPFGKDNNETTVYPMLLGTIAGFYSDLGDLKSAISYYEQSAALYETILGKDDKNYAEIRFLLANTYMKADSIELAIAIMRDVVRLQKKNLGERHTSTLNSYNNLASFLAEDEKIVEAIEIREYLSSILKSDSNLKEMYALNIHNLAGCYFTLNDVAKAIEYATESMELRKTIYGENSIEYAKSLSNLAGYYADSYTNDSLAISLCQQSLEIKRRLFGENDIILASTLSLLAALFEHRGDVTAAISTTERALSIREKSKDVESSEYANLLSNLSLYHIEGGNYKDAIRCALRAADIYNKIYGEKHLKYGEQLAYLAEDYSASGDYHSATLCMSEALDVLKYNTSQVLDGMGEKWKSLYWSRYHTFFNWEFPNYVANDNSQENVALLYDNLLFAKGLLISSQISTRRSVTWKDIQSSLKDNEVAIEFSSGVKYNIRGDSLTYSLYALTLKKDHSPRMYKILDNTFTVHGSNEHVFDDLLSDLGDKIWGRLSEELERVTNIYFAPSSLINNIAIEYLHTSNVKNVSEQYNIYRLSTTKEIIANQNGKNSKKAVLYGGLDYYVPEKIDKLKKNDRGGYDYLPQSLEEVNEISRLLKDRQFDVLVYSDENGTEESFKSLSGNHVAILHLATHSANIGHGDEQDYFRNNNQRFIQLESNRRPIYEDKAMTRSFVLLSGGNRLQQREETSYDRDGVLTAWEISKIDLSSTDLVVLSSCESGLGDMGFDDAMMGLQRGFKKAGAKTILMTLSKVDDEATRILMVEFYKNLMVGKSKLNSLRDAQKYLREMDNGKYSDPKYWASFILLDGLN